MSGRCPWVRIARDEIQVDYCGFRAIVRSMMKPLALLSALKQRLVRGLFATIPDPMFYQSGGRPDILLFSSRRGGSTHLAGLISLEPGMRRVDQPFDLFSPETAQGRIKAKHLPAMPMSQFIHLTKGQSRRVQRYMKRLLSGGFRALSPPELDYFNRTVVKICNASPLIDWFAENFDVQILYLVRHPVPQSLSVLRNEWGSTALAYMENREFADRLLSPVQKKLANQILMHGSDIEQAVLNWALENLYPLNHAKGVSTLITYEELVLYPEKMLNFLAKELDLGNGKAMEAKVSVPSATSGLSDAATNQAIRSQDREYLLTKWQEDIDVGDRKAIQFILDAFEISEYSVDSPVADESLRHFVGDDLLPLWARDS